MPAATHLRPSAIRTLVLVLAYPHTASYYDDWRDAFLNNPLFDTTVENILGLKPAHLQLKLKNFDAVIILHSCNGDTLEFVQPLASALAARNRGKLMVFNGNEFNSPYVSMEKRIAFLRDAKADIVATQLLLEAGAYLYASTNCRVVAVPHALNPQAFKPGGNPESRPLNLGVKGYRYPAYLGDDDRNRMITRLTDCALAMSLKLDISEDRRLSRDDWSAFLGSCRGTVSTEAGSWYISPDDDLMKKIHDYLRTKDRGFILKNESVLRRAARVLPTPIKAALWTLLKKGPVKFEVLEDYKTSFEELANVFFAGRPRPAVYGKAISSRHFDAIGKKTCQILLEGRYNDILTAGQHYIPIKSDLSNVREALAQFEDPRLCNKIVDNAYDHIIASHTYAHRAEAIYNLLTESAPQAV